tara:strand:+ start:2100 stop:2657 length:558 start_codon:yes stop_codon:yes gene_type:complete
MGDEYAGYREAESSTNLTTVLVSLADEMNDAMINLDFAQAALDQAKAELKDIVEIKIPSAVDGMSGKFDLGDGRELTIKEDIRASIAGDKKNPAINWMDEHGYGHIVKRKIVVEFPKGEEERTAAFLTALKALETDLGMLNIKQDLSVHHATLTSWVKEQLADGVDIPTDVFGIFRQRTAKLKEL